MGDELNSDHLKKMNRRLLSIKLHPKTLLLLKMLSEEEDETKTKMLEKSLWYCFDKGLLTSSKKTREKIQGILEESYPKDRT